MKILVPTDFSDRAQGALSRASAWARRHGGSLLFLHVAAAARGPDSDAETRLRALQDCDACAGLSSETHLAQGIPHAVIAKLIVEHQVDLVVMAARGLNRLQRLILGSTTERVVRSAPCAVLVVRGPEPAAGDARRILVATDFSEQSLGALAVAVELARETHAELVLLHVLREADHSTRDVLSPKAWKGIRQRCTARLEVLQREHVGDRVASQIRLVEGDPSAAIAKAAAAGVDLIVLGSRGRSGLRDFLLGSTAERVVRVAPCTVYINKASFSRGGSRPSG